MTTILKPNSKPQEDFLSSDADIVVYGGAKIVAPFRVICQNKILELLETPIDIV
jgi:hypothetical protein